MPHRVTSEIFYSTINTIQTFVGFGNYQPRVVKHIYDVYDANCHHTWALLGTIIWDQKILPSFS